MKLCKKGKRPINYLKTPFSLLRYVFMYWGTTRGIEMFFGFSGYRTRYPTPPPPPSPGLPDLPVSLLYFLKNQEQEVQRLLQS